MAQNIHHVNFALDVPPVAFLDDLDEFGRQSGAGGFFLADMYDSKFAPVGKYK